MEICNPYIIKELGIEGYIVGKPYRMPGMVTWKVAITESSSGKRHLYDCPDKPSAEKFRADLVAGGIIRRWELPITDSVGLPVRTEHFFSEADCTAYAEKSKETEIVKVEGAAARKLDEGTSFLESYIKGDGDKAVAKQNKGQLTVLEDTGDLRADYRDKLKKKEEELSEKAKGILVAVASFYLKGRQITDDEYAKYKLKMEQEGLTSLLVQLDIAKQSIAKLSEDIHCGKASASSYEALTVMQRFVFDINKYQHEYVASMEKSMKQLREDVDNEEYGKETEGQAATFDSKEGLLTTNDRAKLIEEINIMVEKTKEKKTPLSPNKRLHKAGDTDAGDQVNIKHGDQLEDDGGSAEGGTGLETFEG